MGSIAKSLCSCGIGLADLAKVVEEKAFEMYFGKTGYRGIEELLTEMTNRLEKDSDGAFMLRDRLDCPAKFRTVAIDELKKMLENRGTNTADELYDMAMSLSYDLQNQAIEQFKNACGYVQDEPDQE